MNFIKNTASSTLNAAKSAVDWDEDKKATTNGSSSNEASASKKNKKKDDDDSDILSVNSEEAEEAGEIVADVFTFGMYSAVSNSVEAYDKYEENQKKKKKENSSKNKKADKKNDDDDSIGSDEVDLAGEIAANVATMGMYGDIKNGIEEYQQESKQEEQKKKNENAKQ